MAGLRNRFGGGSRKQGNCDAIFQIAGEVVEGERSMQGALNEVRHPSIIDSLTESDFAYLDQAIVDAAPDYREYALVLARLTHAAARASNLDLEIVDAALRLDSLLPPDDPSRERDQLLRDAYTIAQRAGYAAGGKASLARLGQRALESDEFDRARTIFQQQLDIADENQDTVADVDAAIMLGDVIRREGDPATAQTYFRRAARSGMRLEYPRGVAEALNRQIELLDDGNLEMIIAMQRQALDAARHTTDLGLQARITLDLAESLAKAGKIEEVIEELEDGIDLAREIGDISTESECLHSLAAAYRKVGDLAGVAGCQEDIFLLEERVGNRPAAAKWALRLGGTLLDLGKPNRAGETYSKAQKLAVSLNDEVLEGRAIGGIGIACAALGRPSDALDHLMQALAIARRTNDLPREAEWLASIGNTLWNFDQPEDAVRALNESLAIARRIDDVELQANLLTLLGDIQVETGQLPRAREAYHRALDLSRRLGDEKQQVALLSSLGNVASLTGQTGQAEQLFGQALKMATERGDRVSQCRLHGRLGQLARRSRNWTAAIEHFHRAEQLAEAIDDPRLLAQATMHLAAAQHAVGDPAAAGSYRRALLLVQQTGDLQREALIFLNLGTLVAETGRIDEGLELLYRAADMASEMGPAGENIADQADAAIAGFRRNERSPGSFTSPGVYRDDEVFSESTIPPQ